MAKRNYKTTRQIKTIAKRILGKNKNLGRKIEITLLKKPNSADVNKIPELTTSPGHENHDIQKN